MMYNYRNSESFYESVIKNIESKLRKKYNEIVEKNPMILLDYLKEIRMIDMDNISQNYIYPFAKLSIQGHMPLIVEECFWENKFANFSDDKPIFVAERESVPECYKEHYDKNPLTCWGSDFGSVDGSFEIIVQYENNIKFRKSIKDTFDVTIKVDKDLEGHRLFKDNPLYRNEGKACFVFRVNTKDNDDNVIKVLQYIGHYIINVKIERIMNKFMNNMVDEIGECLTNQLIDNIEL